jgi:C4-dicarboxylate-specific signal transduction histidine kinase
VLPLLIAAFIDIRDARQQLLTDTAGDLEARSEQVAREIDAMNRGYQRNVHILAGAPAVLAFCMARAVDAAATMPNLGALMAAFVNSDAQLRGVAILDTAGVVRAASEAAMVGADLSFRQYVKTGLSGRFVISDVFLAELQVTEAPSIAYATPVLGPETCRAACR